MHLHERAVDELSSLKSIRTRTRLRPNSLASLLEVSFLGVNSTRILALFLQLGKTYTGFDIFSAIGGCSKKKKKIDFALIHPKNTQDIGAVECSLYALQRDFCFIELKRF
jgi:hypothetical protein